MSRVVIVSDTHGRNDVLQFIPSCYRDTIFLHCGDLGFSKPSDFPKWLFVKGNCDKSDAPISRVVEVGHHKILMMHSHTLPSLSRKEELVKIAKEKDCDIVCYGHTHEVDMDTIDGIVLINPGSTHPIGHSSYCVLDLEENGIFPQILYKEYWPF